MAAKIIVLSALVAIANAGIVAGPLGGHSVSSRKQDDFGNYNFNYQVTDGLGATNGRWEAGNAWGGVVGSYNLADIDGRSRRVDYVADGAGFRAKVKTNEPGTAASLPAAAVIASPYPGHVSAGPVAGPVVAKAAVAAPVFAAPAVVAPVVAKAVVGPAFGGYGAGLGYGGYGHGAGLGFAGYGHGAGLGYGGYGHGAGLGYAGYGHGAGLGYGRGFGFAGHGYGGHHGHHYG